VIRGGKSILSIDTILSGLQQETVVLAGMKLKIVATTAVSAMIVWKKKEGDLQYGTRILKNGSERAKNN